MQAKFYSTCGQCKSATSGFVFGKSVAVLQRQLRDDFGRTGKPNRPVAVRAFFTTPIGLRNLLEERLLFVADVPSVDRYYRSFS